MPSKPNLQAHFQRRSKTSSRASKNARVTNAAISFVVRPLIGSRTFRSGMVLCLGVPVVDAQMDEGPRSGDPFRLALVFCGVAGLTAAPCPAALHAASHAQPGELRAASHAAPGDLHAALDAAPSLPSGPQHLTRLGPWGL